MNIEGRSKSVEKFILRMEPGMRDRIKILAALNRRTMNAEINIRLLESLSDKDMDRLDEVCS